MALPPPRTASPRYAVRPADADDLRAAQGLVAAAFGLSALETFPAWEMAVVTSNGGLALVAKDAKGVFGFSYAFPAFARGLGAYLYSNALVVDCSHAGLGVGRRLKLEQRRRAVNAGYTLIRWTTDALSSRNLFLYLTRLGARVTAVRREFMRGLLEQPVDQLQVDWDLTSSAPGHVDPPTLGDCVVLTSRVASPDEWPELIERSRRVDGRARAAVGAAGSRRRSQQAGSAVAPRRRIERGTPDRRRVHR